jgi:hypothetical protein
MAEIIVQKLNCSAEVESTYGWDYIYPSLVGSHCLVSKVSMVEHFARDRHEAGMHTTNSGNGPDALIDFERSRAINPTPYLYHRRDEVIGKILGWD